MSDIEIRIRSIFDGAGLDAAQVKLQQFAQTSLNPQAFKHFSIGIAQVQKDFSNLAVLDKNFFQGMVMPAGHTQSIEKATTALRGMGLSVNQANYAINNLNQPTGQLVKNLNVVEQQAEKTGKAIGGFTGYLLRHVAYMGMFMAIYGLVNVFSEISRNAMEEATALNKLDAVLTTVTSSHQLATAQVHDFAQSIAVTTLITQHQAIDAYQRFIALGASVAGAFDLVTSAVNLAAARNISLEFATEALARGMEGQYTRLTRLGVVTKDASGKALDFEQILGKLNEQFAGVAADQMDGYVGQLKAFSAAMVEATEVVGNFWNELKGKVATTFLSVLKTAGALDFSGSFAAYRAQLATLQQLREAAVATGGYVPLNKVNLSTEQLDKQIAEIQKIIDLYDKYKSIGEKNSTITLKIIDLEEQRSPIQEEVNRLVQEEIDLRTKLLGLKPLETVPPPEKTISGIYASGFADYGSQLQKLMKVEAPPLIDLYKNIFATGDLEKNQEQLEKTKNKLKEIDDELARIKHDAWTLGNLDKYFPDLQGFTPKITEEKAKSIIETLNTQKKYYQTLLDIEEAEGDISGIQKRKNELQGALQVLKMFYEQQLALDSTNRDYLQGLADVKLKLAEIEAAAEKVKEANAKTFVDYTVSHAEFQLDIGTGTRENVITKLKGQLQFVQDELSKLTPGTAEWAEKLQEVDGILKLIDGQYKGIADDAAKIVSLKQQHIAAMAELGQISQGDYLDSLKSDLAAAEAELKKLKPDTLPWQELQAVVDGLKGKIANAVKEAYQLAEALKSAQVSYGVSHAEYLVGKAELGYGDQAAADAALKSALSAEEAYNRAMAAQVAGTAEVYSYLQKAESIELQRLQLEREVTKELQQQAGLFNLPEFVRFGLPMMLAGSMVSGRSGGGGGGGAAPVVNQTNNITVAGGYQMSAEEIASQISGQIYNFSQASVAGLRAGGW